MQNYLREIIALAEGGTKGLYRLVILFAAISILDLVGIALVGPYIAIILDPSILLKAPSLEKIGLVVDLNEQETVVYLLSIVLVGVVAAKAIAGVWISRKILVFSQVQEVALRRRLISAYQAMPYDLYLQRRYSEYIHTISQLVSQYSSGVLVPLLKSLSELIVAIAMMIVLGVTDWVALVILLGAVGVLVLAYDLGVKKIATHSGKAANEVGIALVQAVSEAMRGFKEIRILGKEKFFFERVVRLSKQYSVHYLRTLFIGAIPRYVLEFGIIVFIVGFALFSIRRGLDPVGILSTLAVFGYAALRLVPAANVVTKSLVDLRANRNAVKRIYDDLGWLDRATRESPRKSLALGGEIEFSSFYVDNVSYGYPGREGIVLDDVNLHLKSGEFIGIVGESGAGKTTLINILLGLLKPTSGQVLLNGKDIALSPDAASRLVGYLPQELFLISDELALNVGLGFEYSDLNITAVNQSLDKAQLTMLVKQLPYGIRTRLGENGADLSGGQRQRIAIARAFYHRRKVWILDEATNALDQETEQEIHQEISEYKGEISAIIITHKMENLRFCDRVYRLEGGTISDQGSYNAVIEKMEVAGVLSK